MARTRKRSFQIDQRPCLGRERFLRQVTWLRISSVQGTVRVHGLVATKVFEFYPTAALWIPSRRSRMGQLWDHLATLRVILGGKLPQSDAAYGRRCRLRLSCSTLGLAFLPSCCPSIFMRSRAILAEDDAKISAPGYFWPRKHSGENIHRSR